MPSGRPSAFVAALVALALTACSPTVADEQYFGAVTPPRGQVLRYVSGSEPESLDPQIASGQPEARLFAALYEGLTEFDPETGVAIPGLAERWEAADANTTFTFHLRRNARWSNGDPITAHDFVYTVRRGLDPKLASRNAYLAYDILRAQDYNEGGAARADDVGVEALDDHTVRIRTTSPVPFLPGLLAHQFFRVVHRATVERFGDGWTRPERIVTSGAFMLKARRPYDRIVVVPSPAYWDRASVRLDEITFYPLEELTTMMNLYKAGEIDAVYNNVVPTAWLGQIAGLRDYMNRSQAQSEFYVYNVLRPPMDDVRVRKAFNMAIDKAGLARFRRVGTALTGLVPERAFVGYPNPPGDAFDPARARALLAEAGYRGADGQYDPSTFPLAQVELTYNTGESNRQNAEFVQAQWKRHLGLTVPLKAMEFRTLLAARAARDYRGVARAGWASDYMDPFSFLNIFSTSGGENGSGWTDPRFRDMLLSANREADPVRRYTLLAEAEAYLLAAQPIIPLLTYSSNWMKKPYVKGMYANPITIHAWKYVYIEHDPARWD